MTNYKPSSLLNRVSTLCPPFFLLSSYLVAVVLTLTACTQTAKVAQVDNEFVSSIAEQSKHQTEIYRDEYGTPHVVSNSNYGVYFGYGYAVATDRLFQMEMLRRTVEGRVAEVMGEEYFELDKHIRTAYDHRAVSRQLRDLGTEDREVLQGYADGFSRRVKEVLSKQGDLLPKEFSDYDFLPQAWSVEDVAMIFVGSIIHRYSDFNSELDSQSLIDSLEKRHGADTASKIYNASKWLLDRTSPTTVPRFKQSARQQRLPQVHSLARSVDNFTKRVVLDDKGQFIGTTEQLSAREYHQRQIANRGYTGPEYSAASNFWSVSSNKLSDAEGVLVNGPQFGFGLPSYVYGIGLHGGDFNVVGNTLLGLPSLLFAHNNVVSWGSTAGMSDQVDVFRERLIADSPEHYFHKGMKKPFETWTETINVRGGETVRVIARRSVHGMVVKTDPDNGVAYSRARAWEGAELKTLMAWVNLAKEKSLDAVQARLSDVAANINFYYMDVAGNIGYTHGGRYPQRTKNHDSRVPADGTGQHDWLGYRPYSDNPNVRNPEQGFIANWNNRPSEGWLASDLWTYTWSQADRQKHIVNELNSKQEFSADEVWDIAERVSYNDVSALFLMPYLEQAMGLGKPSAAVKNAYQTLKDWDSEWRLHSNGTYGAAELIVESWTKQLFELVLLDDIGKEKFGMYSATNNPNHPLGPSMPTSVGVKVILRNLQLLNSDTLSYDFFNGVAPEEVLLQSFVQAINTLIENHGSDISKWSLAPAKMTWRPYNFRGVPQASEDSLVTLPAYMNRGSENNLFIARNKSFTAYDVIPPGQSGFVSGNGTESFHTKNQMGLYSDFKLKPVPFTLKEVKAAAVSVEPLNQEQSQMNSDQSAVERVRSSLEKAKQAEDFGSMIHLDNTGALRAAKIVQDNPRKGTLAGVPLVVKDNTHVEGMPNTAGTPALRGFVPTENNPSVQRLIDAGAVVIGKANMHELAFGITSNNAAFGAVKNAVDPSRIAGGSSGGTAVAVAKGIVDMGLGTDTGGSTRIPPALNGVVGFRPTQDRYPSGGVTPVSSTRDTVGPIANTVSNAALLDCVITNCKQRLVATELKGLRLGVPRGYFYDNLSPEVQAVTERALEKLAGAGVVLVEVDMPGLADANNGASFPVALYEFMQEVPVYLAEYRTGVSMQQLVDQIASPDVKATVLSQMGEESIPVAAYRAAIEEYRPALVAIYRRAFEKHKVAAMVVPTTPLTATPIATSDETVNLNGVELPTFPTFIRNTDPTSNAGLPSLTLPSGKDKDGLPVGLMLDGPQNSDRLLFSIGLAIEQLLAN